MILGSHSDSYHSGPIILDNSQGSMVMIHVSVPNPKLELKSMTIQSSLEMGVIMYSLLRLLPVIILLVSFTVSLNITIFAAFFVAIILIRCLSRESPAKLKDEDQERQPISASAGVPRIAPGYYDLD